MENLSVFQPNVKKDVIDVPQCPKCFTDLFMSN